VGIIINRPLTHLVSVWGEPAVFVHVAGHALRSVHCCVSALTLLHRSCVNPNSEPAVFICRERRRARCRAQPAQDAGGVAVRGRRGKGTVWGRAEGQWRWRGNNNKLTPNTPCQRVGGTCCVCARRGSRA